jgi:putative ABC transport system permease protein
MKRLAAGLLERTFGAERARSIMGDLEEDLARGDGPRWASRSSVAKGAWLLGQAMAYAIAAKKDARSLVPEPTMDRDPRSQFLPSVWHDVRDAIRSLRAAPTFTFLALVVLALAIGASTAIFSVVDAVALRSLPYVQPDRLVQVGTIDLQSGTFDPYQAPQDFADWQARQDVFVAMAASSPAGGFTVTEDGVPRNVPALEITSGYFDVYGGRPQLGRAFTTEDEVEGSPRVALISDGFWRRQFGADPRVLGRTLHSTSGVSYGQPFPVPAGTWTIVGVMPRGFRSPVSGPDQTDVWVPYVVPESQRTRAGSRSAPLEVTGRLADGVTVADADARIRAITASLARAYPTWFTGERGAVRTLQDATVGTARPWMLLLLGAVGVVLLIACVNVANLMLARAAARASEMRTRAALGASRWRLTQGLLVESLVLATAGTLLGLVVAVWGVDVLRAALPDELPRMSTIALNVRVLGVAALVCVATGLLFGLAPALQVSRSGLASARVAGSRGSTAGGARLRSALVVSEIALAVVLTIGAGLFLSSFIRVANVDIGLDPHQILTMDVWPRYDSSKPGWPGPELARAAAAIPAIVDRVAAMPGVVAVGFIAGDLPLGGYSARSDVTVPGRDEPFSGTDRVDYRYVTPGYAAAVGTRVRRGRYLDAGDRRGSTPVVVLNEEAVARYFGGRDPLGATMTIARDAGQVTVVGVVGNVRLYGPDHAVRPEAYLPAAQGKYLGGALAVRTAGDPLALADAVRGAVRASFPDIPKPEARTMDSRLGGLLAQRRFNMLVVGLFGALALAIASAGLYGVMAYLVTQRTREIGVRLALGATPTRVMRAVVGRGVVHTAAGVAIGVALAWRLATSVENFLFEVGPHDVVVYGAAAALLAACGVVAALVPARRAARVNPVIALRAE